MLRLSVSHFHFLISTLHPPPLLFYSLNMAPFGTKVICIEPGFFRTNVTDMMMLKKSLNELWSRLPQDVKDDYGADFLELGE